MTISQEYKKQRRRVLALLNRMEKEGYWGAKLKAPKIPKRITRKSVNALARMTRETVAQSLDHFVNYETGEIMSASVAAQRQKARQDPWKSALEVEREKRKRKKMVKPEGGATPEPTPPAGPTGGSAPTPPTGPAGGSAPTPPTGPAGGTPTEPETPQDQAGEEDPWDGDTGNDVLPYEDPLIQALIDDLKAQLGAQIVNRRGNPAVNDYYRAAAMQKLNQLTARDKKKLAENIEDNGDELSDLIDGILHASKEEEIAWRFDRFIDIISQGF